MYLCTIILNACVRGSLNGKTTIQEERVSIGYITDSISPYGYTIEKFGNDSVYAFAEDGYLSYIIYLDTAAAINKILFTEGQRTYIEYNPSKSAGSIMSEYFFHDTNMVSSRVYMKDTIILTANNPVQCNKLIIDYYKNGKVKEHGYQGIFEAQGIPVGVCAEYDSLGNLNRTKNYIYLAQKDDNDIFTYIIESEYYDNGNPKWEKKYTNHVFCDFPEEYKEPIGTWQYYDENGKLIKTEKYN